MTIDQESVLLPAHGVVFRRLSKGKGAVLLKLETGAYHALNETGAILWGLMGSGEALSRIADAFAAILDNFPSSLAIDLQSFFADLASRNLIEIQAPSATPAS